MELLGQQASSTRDLEKRRAAGNAKHDIRVDDFTSHGNLHPNGWGFDEWPGLLSRRGQLGDNEAPRCPDAPISPIADLLGLAGV